jgi:hypothetical protein
VSPAVLIYCADHKCSHVMTASVEEWPDDVRLSDVAARPKLAATTMAFRVAAIARSLDTGHLPSFSDCVARVKCDLAHVHRWFALVLM